MKGKASLLAKVAGLFVAAALLAGCYAQLADQNGYFNISVKNAPGGPADVIVLVANSGYENTFKEMLFFMDSAKDSQTFDAGQLATDFEELATGGLVKFGGFPFYRTTIDGISGSFQIPGVPASRSYFVKLMVFQLGQTLSLNDLADLSTLVSKIQLANLAFSPEKYSTAWQNWVRTAGEPVDVLAGQTTTINVNIVPMP